MEKFQIFPVSICYCAKRYHVWFPHLNYENLHIIADFHKLFTQKYQYNSWTGWQGIIHNPSTCPKVLLYIYLKYTKQIQSWKWNPFYFIHSSAHPPFFSFIVECVFLFWVGRSEKEKNKTKIKLEKPSGARRPGTSA